MKSNLNVHVQIKTNDAPFGNYRGESEENLAKLQTITKDNQQFPFISGVSICYALRNIFRNWKLPSNRSPLANAGQPAVEFKDFPDASKYIDDAIFGFLVVDDKAISKNKDKPPSQSSILRLNMAVSLLAYQFDTSFHQSPLNAGTSPWKNSTSSALLNKEITHTSFQFPFAINGQDCEKLPTEWIKKLFQSFAELSKVAGGHARSHYEMSPQSVVARLTPKLTSEINLYGFDSSGKFADLSRINKNDLPGNEFFVGGELVRNMTKEENYHYTELGVRLYDNPAKLLEDLANHFCGEE
jgi:CRISPR-associated protein Cst2